MTTIKNAETKRSTLIVTYILAFAILIPSVWGFGSKFIEFVQLFNANAEGVFTLTPIVNYLLASFGFFCMLCWAISNGMFRNIENPKVTMLEREELIDQVSSGNEQTESTQQESGKDGING